ncbi:hypothetical protein X965_19130 [Morganella sp. EGD-HP17]|nr:hypothetical protein X965_19130 [Morganella sp. EGD-HP17]
MIFPSFHFSQNDGLQYNKLNNMQKIENNKRNTRIFTYSANM